MSPMLSCPLDILVEIFNYVEGRDLLRCSMVCQRFHGLVTESVELQYKIELAADNLIDNPSCALITSERLKLLFDRRNAWRTLKWTKHQLLHIPGGCLAYEFAGGVFAKLVPSAADEARQLIASYLPTSRLGERQIHIRDLGTSVNDFAIDPTQDLVTLLEHRMDFGANDIIVHVRTLSAVGKVHPQSKTGILRVHLRIPPYRTFTIQIAKDVVGVYYHCSLPGLALWNWMTGEMLAYIDDDGISGTAMSEFSFISPRAYMMTSLHDGGSISVFTFGGQRDNPVTRVATLRLPVLDSHCELFHLLPHSGPFLGRVADGEPFGTAPEARVHLVKSYVRSTRMGLVFLCIVVHNRALLRYIERYAALGNNPSDEQTYISWEEWGPDATRFLTVAHDFYWMRFVHGERLVCPVEEPDGSRAHMHVLDFNIASARRTCGSTFDTLKDSGDPQMTWSLYESGRMSEACPRIVTEPSRSTMGGIFKEPVESKLPYTSIKLELGLLGCMIDERHLLPVKAGVQMSPAGYDFNAIDVFVF